MKIIKYIDENIAIIKHDNISINVKLDELVKCLEDPKQLVVDMENISHSNKNRSNC